MNKKPEAKAKIEYIKTGDLIPYARNSRTHSDGQVTQIASSIREFGFTNPILIDAENGIIAGHGRVMAAQKLGMNEVPTICLSHLTNAQRKAYVIADNKLALNAGWDEEILGIELADLRELDFDLSLTGFDGDEIEEKLNPDEIISDHYSSKITAPVYEPKGEKPNIEDLADTRRRDELVKEIESSEAPEEVKSFLRLSAERHTVFNYGRIAEFYCHSDKKTQEMMEDSALVIIDFEKAMQLGYVKIREEIANAIREQEGEESEE